MIGIAITAILGTILGIAIAAILSTILGGRFCSKKLGIKYGTLRDRYQRGDRNERLLRPVEKK